MVPAQLQCSARLCSYCVTDVSSCDNTSQQLMAMGLCTALLTQGADSSAVTSSIGPLGLLQTKLTPMYLLPVTR